MKIFAHTLFKNEERWLWFSVVSVIDYVDKVLLWDTGSTDRSWEIAKILKKKYKDKIDLRQYGNVTIETFYEARRAMLDKTDSDWFIVVDGDEIWWDESIKKVINFIKNNTIQKIESVVVPNINLVGDIFHHLPDSAGNYTFGKLKGNYALRAIKKIDGLKSSGNHGVWGWVDCDGRQIQDRNLYQFINAPYLHATFLPRGKTGVDDVRVPKRVKKLKHEIGQEFERNFYYPESFFKERPNFILSPWKTMTNKYKFLAGLQTPFKKIKRRFIKSGIGY